MCVFVGRCFDHCVCFLVLLPGEDETSWELSQSMLRKTLFLFRLFLQATGETLFRRAFRGQHCEFERLKSLAMLVYNKFSVS